MWVDVWVLQQADDLTQILNLWLGKLALIIRVRWGPVKSWGGRTGVDTLCVVSCSTTRLFYCHVSIFTADENIPAKILSYNRANRAVAILCNHQRAPPKTFEKSMMNLQSKVSWIWVVGVAEWRESCLLWADTLKTRGIYHPAFWAGIAEGQFRVCSGRKVYGKDKETELW